MSDATETLTAALSPSTGSTEPGLPTPLADALGKDTVPYLGALTPVVYSDVSRELSALTAGAGVFDRGHRVRVRITGSDRVRWLNGMVTNTAKALMPGEHNYTFILNAQGRIQGDAQVFALEDALILETDRSQLPHLQAHLDRFIIMDDVDLAPVPGFTTLGVAGPNLLQTFAAPSRPGSFTTISMEGIDITLVNMTLDPARPRYDLWADSAQAAALWDALEARGCAPCGVQAVEALRVLEGVPLFGADIQEKTLPQETGQSRALNFSKGCYLGQEIVERIRSRATVHRSIRQFALHGAEPAPGAPLLADGAPAGELTSVAAIDLPGFKGILALGTIRNQVIDVPGRQAALAYPGGTATTLPGPPSL